MEIETFIENALSLAVAEAKKLETDTKYNTVQMRHAMRSQEWVKALVKEFQNYYKNQGEENVCVLTKYDNDNRKNFGLNELLFDISVVKINTIESPRHKKITYIEKALWLVESEMATFRGIEGNKNKLFLERIKTIE